MENKMTEIRCCDGGAISVPEEAYGAILYFFEKIDRNFGIVD